MCGRDKHGGFCCSQRPWQHAYCAVVNKGLPPWHNTIATPGGVNSHQGQFGPSGNLAQSQHTAVPGTGQDQSGLRHAGQLRVDPAGDDLNGSQGRAEAGANIQGQQRADGVITVS